MSDGIIIHQNENLKTMFDQISTLCSEWTGCSEAVTKAAQTIQTMESWKGESAEKAKLYMQVVYGSIVPCIEMLVTELQVAFTNYYGQYSHFDSDAHAINNTSEIAYFAEQVKRIATDVEQIDSEARGACGNVSDICNAGYKGLNDILDKMKNEVIWAEGAITSICSIEKNFVGSLSSVETLCKNLDAVITKSFGQTVFKFSISSAKQLTESNEYKKLLASYEKSYADAEVQISHYEQSVDYIKVQLEQLQREYEERAEKAAWIKVGVALVGTVVSVVLTPVTGGASVVLLGAITGTVNGFVGEICDQYVEFGGSNQYNLFRSTDLEAACWSALSGGVNGAISSALGVGIGKITGLSGATTFGGKLLQGTAKEGLKTLVTDFGLDIAEGLAVETGRKLGVDDIPLLMDKTQTMVDGKIVTTYVPKTETKYWEYGHKDENGNWVDGHFKWDDILYSTVTDAGVIIVSETIGTGFSMLTDNFEKKHDLKYYDTMKNNESVSNKTKLIDATLEASLKTGTDFTKTSVKSYLSGVSAANWELKQSLELGEITEEEYEAQRGQIWEDEFKKTFSTPNMVYNITSSAINNGSNAYKRQKKLSDEKYLRAKVLDERINSEEIKRYKELKDANRLKYSNGEIEEFERAISDKEYKEKVDEHYDGPKESRKAPRNGATFKYVMPDDQKYAYKADAREDIHTRFSRMPDKILAAMH